MNAQDQLKPDTDPGNTSFASRNAATIIGTIALGLMSLATIWTMFRGP